MRWLLLIFVTFFFTACSNKVNVDAISTNPFKVETPKKSVHVTINNKTKEKIYILYDVKKALQSKGYEIIDVEDNPDIKVQLDIIYAAKIDQKSTTQSILKDVNVNIGLGTHSGNFSIYTKIGSTIGRILGDRLDSTLFQVVTDVKVNDENTQFILTAPLDGYEKAFVIYHIEEQIVQSLLELF